jgi:hypothetical protein
MRRRLDLSAPTRFMGNRKLLREGVLTKTKSSRKLAAFLCNDILVLTDALAKSLYKMVCFMILYSVVLLNRFECSRCSPCHFQSCRLTMSDEVCTKPLLLLLRTNNLPLQTILPSGSSCHIPVEEIASPSARVQRARLTFG